MRKIRLTDLPLHCITNVQPRKSGFLLIEPLGKPKLRNTLQHDDSLEGVLKNAGGAFEKSTTMRAYAYHTATARMMNIEY